jgi:single-stranded-DNA-specific exonuclease
VKYRWSHLAPDPEVIAALRRELELTDLVAGLLVNRGMVESETARRFLQPDFSDLHDPRLMKDMEQAAARIFQAVENREPILIYGDYDVDGITSTVVLKRALEMLGGEVRYHIPKRLEDGYGLKPDVIRQAAASGVGVVISVDSGIRDFPACECARELGLDLIVTDHHLPGDRLPPALAILNPKRADCPYPDKDLAAVGVVMKLVQALFEAKGRAAALPHFLKVVAIGTVADMVPLTGENRIFVKLGLSTLSRARNLGLQALLTGAGVGERIDHYDVGFRLAPRINAFTRMGGGGEVVDLFSVDDPQTAGAIVQEMNRLNLLRREEEDRILAEIEATASADPQRFTRPFLLVWGQGWHRGVIGNVAARLVQRYYRPTLVLSLGEDGAQGSGRSIPGFHLVEALESCAEFFDRFGGHAQAAGCTLAAEATGPEKLSALADRLADYAAARLAPDDLTPVLKVDAVLPLENLSPAVCREIEQLAPFGIANPVPLFSARSAVQSGPWILKERHLKFQPRANGTPLDVIWWQHAAAASRLSAGTGFHMVYSLSLESYQGQERLLATVRDLRTEP